MTQILKYGFLVLELCVFATLLPSERKFRFEIMGEHVMNGKKFYPLLVFKANDDNKIKTYQYYSHPIFSAKWDKDNDYLLHVTLKNGSWYTLKIT